jgi:hypothetical protein
MEASPTEKPAPAEGAQRALPLYGSGKPLDEMRYPPLYQHSKRLGRLNDWDGSEPLIGLGVALVAGGSGAALTGAPLGSKGVLLSLVVGGVLILAGVLVRRENVESARNLKKDFDRDLSLWEQGDPDIRSLREHFETEELKEPQPLHLSALAALHRRWDRKKTR